MEIVHTLPIKLEKYIYMYIFICICLYWYFNIYSILYIKSYFIFIALLKWIHMFIFVFIFIWQFPQVRAQGEEIWGQFRPGWHEEVYSCKNADLITCLWIQLFRQLVFLTFRTTPESPINTELSWEEKVFTTPPLDNFKAAQVFLQWPEGMECWENNSSGNKADWFYLNFLYPTEAHFTCE